MKLCELMIDLLINYVFVLGNYPTNNGAILPGLESLVDVDHILVKQKTEFMEFFNSVEEANQYSIFDGEGQLLFHAVEKSNFFARNLIGKSRGFTMPIKNPQMQDVFVLQRPFRCTMFGLCSPRCTEFVSVQSAQGAHLGCFDQISPKCCSMNMFYAIKDENDDIRLRIRFPSTMSCCSDMQFEVVDMEGNVLGEIRKKWAGFKKEFFTQADNFGITFPIDLDVKLKALLVAACILLVRLAVNLTDYTNNNLTFSLFLLSGFHLL